MGWDILGFGCYDLGRSKEKTSVTGFFGCDLKMEYALFSDHEIW
jgi:hypothetical protein